MSFSNIPQKPVASRFKHFISLEISLTQQQLFAAGHRSCCLLALQCSYWWLCFSPTSSLLQACLAVTSWVLPHQHTHTSSLCSSSWWSLEAEPPFSVEFTKEPLVEKSMQKHTGLEERDWGGGGDCWEVFERGSLRTSVASADYVSLTHGWMVSVEREAYRTDWKTETQTTSHHHL